MTCQLLSNRDAGRSNTGNALDCTLEELAQKFEDLTVPRFILNRIGMTTGGYLDSAWRCGLIYKNGHKGLRLGDTFFTNR